MPAEMQQPIPFGKPISDSAQSKSDDAREAALSELYHDRIEPIIKRFISSKLRISLRPEDESRQNQDGLDLLSETKVHVLQKLQPLNGSAGPEIRDLDAYVRTIAANVFNQFLRKKYPRRLSLKNQF